MIYWNTQNKYQSEEYDLVTVITEKYDPKGREIQDVMLETVHVQTHNFRGQTVQDVISFIQQNKNVCAEMKANGLKTSYNEVEVESVKMFIEGSHVDHDPHAINPSLMLNEDMVVIAREKPKENTIRSACLKAGIPEAYQLSILYENTTDESYIVQTAFGKMQIDTTGALRVHISKSKLGEGSIEGRFPSLELSKVYANRKQFAVSEGYKHKYIFVPELSQLHEALAELRKYIFELQTKKLRNLAKASI